MYERFFGLTDLPFRLTPDPRYLFLSSRHADALAHLKLGLTESSGFVCITGDGGTGKTTLLRHFLKGLGDDVHAAYVFNPALTALELLQTINAEFGLPATSASKTDLVAALNAHLMAEHSKGRRSIVVIDEAQALDLDVLEQLRLLSNLETTTEKLLRIVLVGQPQLRTLLQHPDLAQLNQRITLRWHIGPLTRRETVAYVRHRIAVAADDPSGPPLFTRRSLGRIHRYAGGIPRLINMFAHRALIAGFAAERRRIGTRLVNHVHRELSTVPLPRPNRATIPRGAVSLAAGVALGVAGMVLGRTWLTPAPPEPTAAATLATLVPVDLAAVPPVADAPNAETVLAGLDAAESARLAFAAIAHAWDVPPPDAGRIVSASAMAEAARARGLLHVTLEANASMLRLLDVPAALELHFPGGVGPRLAGLTGVGRIGWTLDVGEEPLVVDDAFLDRFWFGHAHLFWRDDERFGAGRIERGARGERVRRLQAALIGVGIYDGPASGEFDHTTESAVMAFQRAHFLEPDGLVGPLTKLAIHTAARTNRPSLATAGEEAPTP
jgi:general secretion pathway protein A